MVVAGFLVVVTRGGSLVVRLAASVAGLVVVVIIAEDAGALVVLTVARDGEAVDAIAIATVRKILATNVNWVLSCACQII